MSKDPAFLFYPGDYLRDTQCFSEKVQVSYDRIMCEHMRNICISKKQLKFFTKRLSEEEIDELMVSLSEVNGGYQIEWVAESILKRRAYSESRRKNRGSHMSNTCKSYVAHMENENEIVNEDRKEEKLRKGAFQEIWLKYPNKDGRKTAEKHFIATVKTKDDLSAINKALDNYKKHLDNNDWKKPKNGSTWFNNWQDWVEWVEPEKKDKLDGIPESLRKYAKSV